MIRREMNKLPTCASIVQTKQAATAAQVCCIKYIKYVTLCKTRRTKRHLQDKTNSRHKVPAPKAHIQQQRQERKSDTVQHPFSQI
mmetsp:Transcript_19698/g.28896  ORF Transcript_19698/g.28896 Transcript_19698/m.28896 type:complete len:85 (-) Transcript_19698:1017-1271(-)